MTGYYPRISEDVKLILSKARAQNKMDIIMLQAKIRDDCDALIKHLDALKAKGNGRL